MATLFAKLSAAGTPMDKIPLVAKVPLDLYRLHQLVQQHGGFAQVVKRKLWKPVAMGLGISLKVCTDYGFRLRKHYENFLLILDDQAYATAASDPQMLALYDEMRECEGAPSQPSANATAAPQEPTPFFSSPAAQEPVPAAGAAVDACEEPLPQGWEPHIGPTSTGKWTYDVNRQTGASQHERPGGAGKGDEQPQPPCPFCQETPLTKEEEKGPTKSRRRRVKLAPRKKKRVGRWWKNLGYNGEPYCQRCSEVVRWPKISPAAFFLRQGC